jgi:hypothetical protein
MKRRVISIAALVLLSAAALAGEPVSVSGASKVAVGGYDPVAFLTDSKPVMRVGFFTREEEMRHA